MSEHFDEVVTSHADSVIDALITRVLGLRGRGAVVGEAPAGAGKSYAIGTAILRARQAGLRLAVATPTNEQAQALLRDLSGRLVSPNGGLPDTLTYLPSGEVEKKLPGAIRQLPRVRVCKAKEVGSDTILVGTLAKLGDSFARDNLRPFDLLLIDEAFQANSVQYYQVAGLADRHLLMGDRGQLAPFTTAPSGDRWRGLLEDPLLTAVELINRTRPDPDRTFRLPITRRLDPRGAALATAFYPGHRFSAAVRPEVRQLRLDPGGSDALDPALDLAARSGWVHLEMAGSAVSLADRKTIDLICKLVSRLLARRAHVSCERGKPGRLPPHEIAVVVSHNDQKNLLRVELDANGLSEVVVNTANKVQGLTYEVVIAWHPLAGLQEADEFHLDPGRLCVMLTRHRHACIVIGREADRALVEGIPPATPSFSGWSHNPALAGWAAHEAVFDRLAAFRLPVAGGPQRAPLKGQAGNLRATEPAPATPTSGPESTAPATAKRSPGPKPQSRSPKPLTPLERVLRVLKSTGEPMSRRELFEASEIAKEDWAAVEPSLTPDNDIYTLKRPNRTRYVSGTAVQRIAIETAERAGTRGASKADIMGALASLDIRDTDYVWWPWLLNTLCDTGRLVRVGQGRGTRYQAP